MIEIIIPLVLAGFIIYAVTLWTITWLFYLAGMGLAWSAHQPRDKAIEKPVFIVQYTAGVLSTLLNWSVFTFVLLEIPKERFLSSRLLRHYRHGKGWRQKLAGWMGRVWLDPFDPTGKHI